DRQHAYRLRQAAARRAAQKISVTDQTPQPSPISVRFPPPHCFYSSTPVLSTPSRVVCRVCGREGTFLDPFITSLGEVMISKEQIATIRRLYYAEHWKVGTIAAEMRLHPETVKRALLNSSFSLRTCRPAALNPWLEFIQQTLQQHPHLRATRLYQMLRDRGYQ